MSFETELLDLIGTASDAHDIKAMVRKCYHFDFAENPLRIWDGVGRLYAEGQEWIGTIDANGVNHHQSPQLRDARDGSSPRYTFRIPYVDQASFEAMKADQALAQNRELTIYYVLCAVGEGLRPSTPLRFKARLLMQGTEFAESVSGEPGNFMINRSASVMARSLEYGRSRIPNGTYTDTAQKERARLLGFASDSGCRWVAANSRRSYVIGG